MNDRLSDMITRVRNGYLAHKRQVSIPHTKLIESVANIMLEEKYLSAVEVVPGKPHPTLVVTLSYAGIKPAITKIKRISKPGVRIYHDTNSLTPVLSGLGISIVSTSKGVMTGQSAKNQKIGGEVLVELW